MYADLSTTVPENPCQRRLLEIKKELIKKAMADLPVKEKEFESRKLSSNIIFKFYPTPSSRLPQTPVWISPDLLVWHIRINLILVRQKTSILVFLMT